MGIRKHKAVKVYNKPFYIPNADKAHFQAQGLGSAQEMKVIRDSPHFGKFPLLIGCEGGNVVKYEKGKAIAGFLNSSRGRKWLYENRFKIVHNLAKAIAEHNIQRGVFHTDLHLSNILLDNKCDVKFIDYELAGIAPSRNKEIFEERFRRYDLYPPTTPKEIRYAMNQEIYNDYYIVKEIVLQALLRYKNKEKTSLKRLKNRFEREFLNQVDILIPRKDHH